MRIKCLAGSILIAIAVLGCADDVTAPDERAIRPSLSVGIDPEAIKISHAPIRHRFGRITIDTRTPIKVGVPVSIEVSAPVIIATNSAHLELVLPELAEIAFRQEFGANRPAPRAPGPHLRWQGASSRGTLRRTTRLVFPVAGLYRASAQLVTDDPSLDAAGQVQNAAGTVSWIYVTKNGGRVIHSFGDLYTDREASQAMTSVDAYVADPQGAVGIASIPLPCDPNSGYCSPCDLDPYSCEPPPTGTQPGTFSGTLLYENRRVGQTIPLANALMTIFDERGGWNSAVLTDGNGKFTLQCPAASQRGYLQMVATARNSLTEVLDVNSAAPPPDLSYYRPQADASIDKCGTDTGTYLAGKPAQAELFDNMTRTALKSRTTFSGFSRGKIMVRWISGIGDSTASAYTPSEDVIDIYELRSFGEVGLFEAGHEYGHALHQVAMGGVIISGTECQNHDVALPSTFRCGFVEGFADYHAIAVWGTAVGADRYNSFEQGRYVGFPTTVTSARLFGPKTEGAVASTMLHFADGALPRVVINAVLGAKQYQDNAAAGHGQVASAIRDCRIKLSDGSYVKVDGVDYLSYCFEKAVQLVGGGTSCNYWKICTPLPALPVAIVDPDARDRFFGGLRTTIILGRALGPPPATSWSWGTVPARGGYDPAMRIVWACNLFFCS